eukprot:GSChrysophyteH1.ASY1.ANO1.1512.1 assembled CDS
MTDLAIGLGEAKGDDGRDRKDAQLVMLKTGGLANVLPQQQFTASAADITPHSVNEYAIKHKPVSIDGHFLDKENEPGKPPLRRVLDGFHLLEAANAHLPTDVRQAIFVDRGLVDVVEEDLMHFDHLQFLDVSENRLQLSMFAGLLRLKALNLACNSINTVEPSYGFDSLTLLDLSYNQLTQRSVQLLDFLPQLKELDLCGNNLAGLPHEMYRFRTLEKLLLDNNKIDDNNVFNILCTVPNLRYISLAYNFLHCIPEQCCAEGFFALLSSIDLSFNYFGTEEDLQALLDLPRLEAMVLYGNPLLGPKGEDPQYIYCEELHIAATEGREERRLCRIEVTTEIPRKRNFKKLKGRSAGRHASYRGFDVIAVAGDYEGDDPRAAKTNADWREEGNKALFAEAIAQAQKEKLLSTIPDMTFITGVANDEDEKILQMADHVMDTVANDLNLTTSAEILFFQDRTRLAKGAEQPQQQQQQPVDKVPPGMFARTMADPSTLQTQPVAVKTAMRALKFAIAHPLTNYDEVPTKGGLPPKDYVRETKASINRKLPLKPQSLKPLSEIAQIKNKSKRGLGEPSVVAKSRRKAQAETLQQIEDVLDKLNANADEVALKGTGNANTKDGLETMKQFARPQTGLRGLVKMVDEVVSDLGR